METRKPIELSIAGGAALAAAAVIGPFAAVGLAGKSMPSAADQYGKKVTICHHAQGKRGTKHVTIRVSRSALPAHLRHGDTMGACTTRVSRVKHSSSTHKATFHKPKPSHKSKRGKKG